MRTALDAPEEALDTQEKGFVAKIRKHGWFDTHVLAEGEQPEFSFTTGFWATLKRPEIIVFGLKSETAHAVLWSVFRDFEAGKSLPTARRVSDVLGNHQACLFAVDKAQYAAHLGWSRWFYAGDTFPCLQLVWPDRNDVFPWEAGFDPTMIGRQIDMSEGGWREDIVET